VTLNYFASHSVNVLLGAGEGTLAAAVVYPLAGAPSSGGPPHSVALGDLNGDGWLDLVVMNYPGVLQVLLGTGNGQFAPRVDYTTGFGAEAAVLGDVNGDGKLDVVTANNSSASASVQLGTGDGKVSPKTDYSTGDLPYSLALGDMNGDQVLDLVVTRNAGLDSDWVSVLLGSGNGAFGAPADYRAGTGPTSVALSDLNGDARLDIVFVNFNSGTVTVLLATGAG